MSVTTAIDPVKFDTELSGLHGELGKLEQRRTSLLDQAHRMAGDRRRYVGRQPVWIRDDEDVLAEAGRLAGAGDTPWCGHRPSEVLGKLYAVDSEIHGLYAGIETMEATYRSNRWNRFFPCRNADGHIHSSLNGCSTVKVTTDMGWRPDLSGTTVEAAVADLGPTLCSVCFPDAPLDWRHSKTDLRPAGCEGSGQAPVRDSSRRAGRNVYGECAGCGDRQIVTVNGRIRKHQPPSGR